MPTKWLPLALIVLSVLGASKARAEERAKCFTTASFAGSWSIDATYGANVARAFGKRTVDEDGNFTGTFLLNGPTAGSTTGQRTITTGTQLGFITVNCDGTGKITRVLTASNGTVTNQVDDFVVTGAVEKDGRLIATSFDDAVETPSALVPGGIFVTRVQTRVPSPDKDGHDR
jgi:hypothetical protein